MSSCRVTFGTTSLVVTSDHESFLAFMKNYFDGEDVRLSGSVPKEHRLAITFARRGTWSLRGRRIDSRRVTTWLGEGIGLTDDGTFLFEDKELTGELMLENDMLRGNVEFRPIVLKHLANRLLPGHGSLQERYYRLVTRGVVQQLLFMLEAQARSVDILSAASIVWQGRAYVFAGLPGSGKTTTVTHLAQTLPGANILAQNYVPVRAGTTWCFAEGLTSPIEGQFPIAAVYVVAHGEGFAERKLDSGCALANLVYINDRTAELPSYSKLGAFFLGNQSMSAIAHHEHLSVLATEVPVRMVVMDSGLRLFTAEFIKTYGAIS